MKQILLLALVVFSAHIVSAQTEISRDDNGNKILKGFITKQAETICDIRFNLLML